MTLVTAIGAIAGLTFLLASLLIYASRKLYVEEDPRLDVVEEMLPHSNCGACGFPGCRNFAEALVSGEISPAQCTVSTEQARSQIADLLGVEVGVQRRIVARLACAGGSNVSRHRAHYRGTASCLSAAQVAGGGKGCSWGCLGLGDCERVCDFDAIVMDAHSLPIVIEDICTACGDCIDICPKDLFSLQPVDQHLWVPCKNEELGDTLLDYCEVACTACARCAMDAPNKLVTMHNNLPVIDYCRQSGSVEPQTNRVAIERCPTGAILWIDETQGVIKGKASKQILRHTALPEASS